MSHKIEAIDYLRGLALLLLIVIHSLALSDSKVITEYTKLPFLFNLRDLLQFSVVTFVVCSGFSLYASKAKLRLTKVEILKFYKERLKRLLLPWYIFLVLYFIVHYFVKTLFGISVIPISKNYIIDSFLMIGGIGLGWIVLVMTILTLIFPFLKFIYDKTQKLIFFIVFGLFYLILIYLYYNTSFDLFKVKLGFLDVFSITIFAISYIVGWSFIYSMGFLLHQLYNQHVSIKKEIKITMLTIFLFLIVNLIYHNFNLGTYFYLNKYPPTPYYLSFGLMMTFILLAVFFVYKKFIHSYLKLVLTFLSSNSYWFFMWNGLTVGFVNYYLSKIQLNIYTKLLFDVILNLIFITTLIILQKKFIKIEMHFEKQHF